MAGLKVLVIEDEEDILKLIAFTLRREGFSVIEADTGEDGLEKAAREKPAAILLDLMLPGIDGLEVLRTVRAREGTRDTPVIIVSAKGEEVDVVTGLELGADDYVAKPFRPRELTARLRAVLRSRRPQNGPETKELSTAGLTMDRSRREASIDGQVLDLTFTEFEVLYLLASRPGLVFTRYQIVDSVRGEGYAVTDRSVDVQMAGLRKKLGESGKLIQTVRNVGYRFRDEEQ